MHQQVICFGITILQLSKVDPKVLAAENGLDRRSTILLSASHHGTEEQEKEITGSEEPGMDALRGGFGAVGSIIRARSRRASSIGTTNSSSRHRISDSEVFDPRDPFSLGMKRYTLTDEPIRTMGGDGERGTRGESPIGPNIARDFAESRQGSGMDTQEGGRRMSKSGSRNPPRAGTLTFQEEDVVHEYGSYGLIDPQYFYDQCIKL